MCAVRAQVAEVLCSAGVVQGCAEEAGQRSGAHARGRVRARQRLRLPAVTERAMVVSRAREGGGRGQIGGGVLTQGQIGDEGMVDGGVVQGVDDAGA